MRWYVINTKHNHQVVIRRSDASKQELRRCYLPIHSSNGSLCGQETNKYARSSTTEWPDLPGNTVKSLDGNRTGLLRVYRPQYESG